MLCAEDGLDATSLAGAVVIISIGQACLPRGLGYRWAWRGLRAGRGGICGARRGGRGAMQTRVDARRAAEAEG